MVADRGLGVSLFRGDRVRSLVLQEARIESTAHPKVEVHK
jgi:hypothetical protein